MATKEKIYVDVEIADEQPYEEQNEIIAEIEELDRQASEALRAIKELL